MLKFSNYKILKCYKLIASKRMLTKNIGNFILIIFPIVYIYSLTSYICRGVNKLRTRILREKKKEKEEQKKEFLEEDKKVDKKKESKFKEKKKDKKSKSKYYPPKKKKSTNLRNAISEKNKKKKKTGSQKKLVKGDTDYDIDNYNKKYPKRSINIIFNQNMDTNKVQLISKEEKKDEKTDYKYSEKENKQRKFDDFELNDMEYEDAAKHDKRSLIRIYYSLLKREHKILFTFFIHNDYNLFYIKIWRFVFLFASDMAMNALFFTDETMHKLYLTYGKYDFVQQVPQIVYSTVISQILEVFICYLSLTDTPFYEIKALELIKENIEQIKKIIKCINTKLIVFYIFNFCLVYENTQAAYLKDCLISFLLSIILPFIIYIIPSTLRVCAIRDKKISSNCTYKLSEIIPFF